MSGSTSNPRIAVRALILVLVAAVLSLIAGSQKASAADISLVAIDMDPTGNSNSTCAVPCAPGTLGTVDECISVPTGQTGIEIDVVVDEIPSGGNGILGYDGSLVYDLTAVTITGREDTGSSSGPPWTTMFFAGTPAPSKFDLSDSTPDSDGVFNTALLDLNTPGEYGPGTLTRITLTAGTTPGVYPITLAGNGGSGDFGIADTASNPYTVAVYQHAYLAIGVSCSTGATITVSHSADTNIRNGDISLREAMMLATGTLAVGVLDSGECAQISASTFSGTCSTTDPIGALGEDYITFSGSMTITLGSTLPTITTGEDVIDGSAGVTVDGSTQTFNCFQISGPDAYFNQIIELVIRDCLTGVLIEDGAEGNAITGNVIRSNAAYGVEITGTGTDFNTVAGNLIGTNAAGTAADPNGLSGVRIRSGAQWNTIGDSFGTLRNIISGNTVHGIVIDGPAEFGDECAPGNTVDDDNDGTVNDGCPDQGAPESGGECANAVDDDGDLYVNDGCPAVGDTYNNFIEGNFIGTDAAGTADLGNGDSGVLDSSDSGNVIGNTSGNTPGGACTGACNVISGNGADGITVECCAAPTVLGNYIGTNAAGTAAIANSEDGIEIQSDFSTIGGSTPAARNVISGNASTGVAIYSGTDNDVTGNYIGTDSAGTGALPNTYGVGVGSAGNNIGGSTTTPGTAAGNVISGNSGIGVILSSDAADNNTVRGNVIGLNPAGTAVPAGGSQDEGVFVNGGADFNDIGGAFSNQGNVISGNTTAGVIVMDAGTTYNLVQWNHIGTDIAGTVSRANPVGLALIDGSSNTFVSTNVISGNTSVGVLIGAASASDANELIANSIGVSATGGALGNGTDGIYVQASSSGNFIGFPDGGGPNLIAHNGGAGVNIVSGTGNAIDPNSIYSNGGLGIDLGDDGVTPNDGGDGDSGANNLINFPVITSASYDGVQTTITGTLDSSGTYPVRVEVFSTPAGDPEGEVYLGYTSVASAGAWTLISSGAPPYGTFTATATDDDGNTSEFTSPAYVAPVGDGLPLTLVVREGQATPVGGTFAAFGEAALPNTGGDVVFWAAVSGGSASQGIFRYSSSVITKLVAAGDPTPVGGTFALFTTVPIVNAAGDVTFWATVSGGSNPSGIFRYSGGITTKIAAAGDSAPGGGTYTGFLHDLGPAVPVINDDGDIVFFATLSTGDEGIFLYDAGTTTISPVVATGDPTPIGGTYTDFGYVAGYGTVPVVLQNDQVTFWAQVSAAAGQGIFVWDNGVVAKIAAAGDVAPDSGGATFTSLGQIPIGNESGEYVFNASLSTGVAYCLNLAVPCGIYRTSAAGTEKLFQAGDPGPRGIAGTITGLGRTPIMNGAGDITVWMGTADGFASQALVTVSNGYTTNVAAVGNSAPVAMGGAFSTFINATLAPTIPQISDGGQIALWGAVSGGAGTDGIFITTSPTPGTVRVNIGPVEGTTVPGTNGGTFGDDFDLAINSDGAAVFANSVEGGTASHGVFLFFAGSAEPLQSIALQGQDAQGGGQFEVFGPPINNDVGNTVVRSTLAGGGEGVYLFFAGNPNEEKKLKTGEAAPGGGSYQTFGEPSINNANAMAVNADLGTDEGLYLFFAGSPTVTKLAKTGDSIPVGQGGGMFDTFGRAVISDGASNKVAARATLQAGGEGLYLFFAGSATKLGKSGEGAPGGGTFATFEDPVINTGEYVVAPATTTSPSGRGLYLFFAGSAVKLADLTTGTGVGGSFENNPPPNAAFTGPVMTDGTSTTLSVVARSAISGGSVTEGLFLFFAGSPLADAAMIVGTGDSPIENPAITFAGTSPVFPYHAMNSSLELVFVSKITGGAPGSTQGLFFASLDQDSDAVADVVDNCPLAVNTNQANTDAARAAAGYAVVADELGDACDPDDDGDGLADYPAVGGEPAAVCNLLPDCDGDGRLDAQDNCPQFATVWTVPVGDGDCDGVPGTAAAGGWAPESFIGTNPNDRCAADTTANNEPLPDVWPLDFDDNQLVDGSDVLKFGIPFLSQAPGPPYAVRYDFNGDTYINGADVLKFGVFFLKRCTPE